MGGLLFEEQAPVIASAPSRTDIACFAGFVRRRVKTPVPADIRVWLSLRGWTRLPGEPAWAAPPYARPEAEVDALLHLAIPIDTWSVFDALFQWERRGTDGEDAQASTYLGAAVRSYFAQGGRKCYVIRVGDPWPIESKADVREPYIASLIPGYPQRFDPSAADRTSWRGVGQLYGLPDVSFLCVPDLVDAVQADEPSLPDEPAAIPHVPEQFVPCSNYEPPLPKASGPRVFAPRCDEAAYQRWTKAVALVRTALASDTTLREVQFVAALPIPLKGTQPDRDLNRYLSTGRESVLSNGIAGSAFVQLAYPWVRSPGSERLPERLESPDGVLAGVLARNALARGTFRSAANLKLGDVYDVDPHPRQIEIYSAARTPKSGVERERVLGERVSILGHSPSGWRLLTDVTASTDENYRPACLNRLVSVLVRTARHTGEDLLFEVSGERTWTLIRRAIEDVMTVFWQAGALRGESPGEAFQVLCDRSTHTQNDVDAGRVLVRITFEAAAPIETIVVVLSMTEGGDVTLAEGVKG
jgi:hypothetical protein